MNKWAVPRFSTSVYRQDSVSADGWDGWEVGYSYMGWPNTPVIGLGLGIVHEGSTECYSEVK